jgi:hypothetical protein
MYQRVNKSKPIQGIAKQTERQRLTYEFRNESSSTANIEDSLRKHHVISAGRKKKINLTTWLEDNKDDPCLEVKGYLFSVKFDC